MQEFPINWLAVIAAGVARTVIGFLWYSPLLFLRPWREAVGLSEEKMKEGMVKFMLIHIAGNMVMAWVLLHAVHYAGARGVAQGAAVGFFNWLGFILVTQLDDITSAHRPWKLLWINTSNALVSLLVMGAILAVWG